MLYEQRAVESHGLAILMETIRRRYGTAAKVDASLDPFFYSRKRKLLEQFLLPENATATGGSNTISLSDMRTMGLVGQARPSATVQPSHASHAATAPSSAGSAANLAMSASSTTSNTRSPVGGLNFSTVAGYVPSFSFYQSRSFGGGPPSCSGGGSTESLCSSTADSACGHPADLPDDGNLATPAPPLDVSFHLRLFRYK